MIIRRYVRREVIQSFLAVLAVLTLVFVANRFSRFLNEATDGRIASELIFELLALKLASSLVVLLPLAFFFGVLLALGRLSRDSELVALSAGGFGVDRLAWLTLKLAVMFALVVASLSLVIAPHLNQLQDSLVYRARGEAEITGLVAGKFKSFGGGDQVVYIEDYADDGATMHEVFVRIRRGDKEELLFARRAFEERRGEAGDRFIVLEDGRRYAGVPGQANYVVTQFHRHAVRLDVFASRVRRVSLDSQTTLELWQASSPAAMAELQKRISLPLSSVLLAVLAVPLASAGLREARYARLLAGIGIYFAYNNAIGIASELVERGDVPAVVGVWPVHLIVGIGIGVAMNWQLRRHRLWRTKLSVVGA